MNDQMKKGREAYAQMASACNLLVQSGNWQRVGASDIKLFLDMYTQSLLLRLAQASGTPSAQMLRFIAEVPGRDVLNIGKASAESALNIGYKNRSFAEGTPLLLRCCVAMDDKDGTDSAQQFVGGVSQLLYAAADVDGSIGGAAMNFITSYLGSLRTFLLTRAAGRHAGAAQEAARRVDVPGGAAKAEEKNDTAPQKKEEREKTLEELMAELDSLIGLDGVEKTMEDWLTACTTQRVGKRVVEIDRYGAVSRTLSTTEATDGNNIKLTIDSNLQRVAEQALAENIEEIRNTQEDLLNSDSWLDTNKEVLQGTTRDFESNPIKLAEKGAVVVVDMKGRVLALASYPPYDPNAFIVGGDAAADILLDSRNPLVNYAIGSRDTPGSIFKMVTATAGLMNGQLSLTETISDEGRFTKYDSTNPPRCWVNQKRLDLHKDQTVQLGLSHSCNYFFYTVGSRLYENTDNQLYKTAALYGLTTKTGIDLPGELQGYVASQTTLYDKNKAISAAEQATWRPTIVFNQIKQHLIGVGEDYNMTFEEEKLNKCVKRLMDMAVDYNQGDWLAQIRNILMEELDMPREMVYLQAITGDTFIMLNEIKWGGSEAIMCAVGQSITTVTPVALARYIAAIANGGKVYDLRIVDSIISPDGEVLSQSSPILASQLEGDNIEEYLAFIREGMKGVVEAEGTATRFFSDSKYDNIRENMGAKTGTAEKTQIDLENNAWMIAFAPFEEPEIAVCVYIPHGYSGAYCSMTVREIIDYYMDNRLLDQDDFMAPSNSLAY